MTDDVTAQRRAFLTGEGDEWLARNPAPAAPEIHNRLAAYVGPSATVLEIGCADGRALAALETSGRRAGVDPSPAAIEAGKRRWPDLDLRVGTADDLPFDEPFDVVVFGFCLYLCDRPLLPRIVAEADRLLADGGVLAIIDFDPRYPRRRPYRHRPGLSSWKMQYASLFLAFPSYVLMEKVPVTDGTAAWTDDDTARIAMWLLKKDIAGGYGEEPDG